jgi:serine/threonine protein kinase
MIALAPPFLGDDLEAIYAQITEENAPPLPLFYSKELHKLIERMLEKDPKRRPSAEQLLQNVERLVPETFRGLAIVQRVRGQFKHKQNCSLGLLKTILFPSRRERRDNEQEANSYLPSPSFSREHSLDKLHHLTTSVASATMHISRDPPKQTRGKTVKKGVSLYANEDK